MSLGLDEQRDLLRALMSQVLAIHVKDRDSAYWRMSLTWWEDELLYYGYFGMNLNMRKEPMLFGLRVFIDPEYVGPPQIVFA